MNLYIHIPFCASKCSYCHFYSVCSDYLMDDYLSALLTEIDLMLSIYPSTSFTTLYFGGGTPSLMPAKIISQILNKLPLSNCTEITLEAHPNTLTPKKISDYYSLGINRLSIGVQSWNHHILNHMGRAFNHQTLIKNINFAQSIGLTNINLDHIISYPNQTDRILTRDLVMSISTLPTHISIYPLEKHPHTKIVKSPPVTKTVRQFALAQNLLIKHGYIHYEELSFAKPGFLSRHNSDFWQDQDYLGIGVSSVSKIGDTIVENTSSITEYINSLKTHALPPNKITKLNPRQLKVLKTDLALRLLV